MTARAVAGFGLVPRKPRVEYPGAVYHLIGRGNAGWRIFRGDVDRQDFLKSLAETWKKPVSSARLLPDGQLFPPGGFVAKGHRPQGVRVDRLLGEHGIREDSAAGRRQFEGRMEACRAKPSDGKEIKEIGRGWCLGSAEFKTGLLKGMDGASSWRS